jgi:hypothetical protein
MSRAWPWVPLTLLGAYHGLNPGMGWLFALARGLQEKTRTAVLSSLVPIALGHATAIAVALFVLQFVEHIIPFSYLRLLIAGLLFALAINRLLRARHPRGSGMRVGWWGLGWWSFLMASSHGAGLMVIPVLIAHSPHHMAHLTMPVQPESLSTPFLVAAILVHTASLFAVAGVLALLFYETYETSGLTLLRRAWFNFDLLWGCALLVAGIAALLI